MVAFRGRTNSVHCAVPSSTKATFVIHRRESSTATRSASQEEFASPRRQSKIGKGKCHEMLKSRLLPRYWSCCLSARLVQQTTLLFVALPRRRRDCLPEAATTRAERYLLLRVAFLATDQQPVQKLNNSRSRLTKCDNESGKHTASEMEIQRDR
jgi:hypothetical protein